MIVRPAIKEDLFELTKMAMVMHKESDFNDIPFNFVFAYNFLKLTLEDEDSCIFVSEIDGIKTGVFIGDVVPFFFSKYLKASDIAFFVLPQYRGGLSAFRLFRRFEDWAISKKARKIYVSVFTGGIKADAFYDKIGYNRLGGVFRKNNEEVATWD